MRIKNLHIQNYKSLVDFQLENMPQFCAFVGPNASGKSNIFEALEFTNYLIRFVFDAPSFFGGVESILSYQSQELLMEFGVEFSNSNSIIHTLTFDQSLDKLIGVFPALKSKKLGPHKIWLGSYDIRDLKLRKEAVENMESNGLLYQNEYEIIVDNFSRIFVGKSELKRVNQSSNKLLVDASNLSQIIGQIFQDENEKNDFIEWLRILIPEFKSIEVKKNNIDGSFHILVHEKAHDKPFPVHLLSDGTKNILSLMAAVYQNSSPQFLCIEEPENGLHPQAIQFLIDFFREKCETEGHHIWLNTHSPTLVRCLTADELITVNKKDGQTTARQFSKEDAFNVKTDEAWLTNMLGGGVL